MSDKLFKADEDLSFIRSKGVLGKLRKLGILYPKEHLVKNYIEYKTT